MNISQDNVIKAMAEMQEEASVFFAEIKKKNPKKKQSEMWQLFFLTKIAMLQAALIEKDEKNYPYDLRAIKNAILRQEGEGKPLERIYVDELHGFKAKATSKTMAWQLIRNKCHELNLPVPTMDKIKLEESEPKEQVEFEITTERR